MRKYEKQLQNEKDCLKDESIETETIIKNYVETLKSDSVNTN